MGDLKRLFRGKGGEVGGGTGEMEVDPGWGGRLAGRETVTG